MTKTQRDQYETRLRALILTAIPSEDHEDALNFIDDFHADPDYYIDPEDVRSSSLSDAELIILLRREIAYRQD